MRQEEAAEGARATADRHGEGLGVAWDARDQYRARHAHAIELRCPPVGEILRRAGRVPPELCKRRLVRRVSVGVFQPSSERREKGGRKEMTVDVVDRHEW